MKIMLKRAHDGITLPRYASTGAAGCDICASEKSIVRAGCTTIIPTGIFIEVPVGFECQVRPRSGLAAKHGLTVLNSPGTIDSDYRGEIKVIMINTSTSDYEIEPNDRIAQLVFAPVIQASFEEGDMSETLRGIAGFGSTGKK